MAFYDREMDQLLEERDNLKEQLSEIVVRAVSTHTKHAELQQKKSELIEQIQGMRDKSSHQVQQLAEQFALMSESFLAILEQMSANFETLADGKHLLGEVKTFVDMIKPILDKHGSRNVHEEETKSIVAAFQKSAIALSKK